MIQIIANSGKLTKEDQIVPVPQARQALLRVEAVGVGSVDLMVDGADSAFVPGIEVVGRATSVGDGADPALVGQRVFAMLSSGGYAQARSSMPTRSFSSRRTSKVGPLWPQGLTHW